MSHYAPSSGTFNKIKNREYFDLNYYVYLWTTLCENILLHYVWNGLFVNITKNKITLHAEEGTERGEGKLEPTFKLSFEHEKWILDGCPTTDSSVDREERTWYCHKIASKSEAVVMVWTSTCTWSIDRTTAAPPATSCILRGHPTFYVCCFWHETKKRRRGVTLKISQIQ